MRGTYQTKQQEAIENLFSSLGQDCITADEAYRRLVEQGLEIGKTTVYRAITRLCLVGILTVKLRADTVEQNHLRGASVLLGA